MTPKQNYFTFGITDELKTGLQAVKKRDGVSEAEQIRRAIAIWLNEKGVMEKENTVEPLEILEQLKALSCFDSAELYHRTTFEAHRRDKQGQDQEVTITILDAGPRTARARYHCVATTRDGKSLQADV